MIALTEAAEFGDVGDFISQYGEHGVRRTLGRVLDGPVLPADEDPNSNDPRNRLFEFVIASKLWRAGLQPRLGDRPDVSCEVRGKTFFIECKRPLTARGVKGRITDAAAMLPDRIDATGGQALGVIALSLTRRLNLGDKLLVYRGEADGKEKLSRALATAAAFARSDWERLPGNIVGLLWHAITPALDESIHLYTIAQYMNVQPLAPPLSFEEQWFRLLYEAPGRIWGHA